MVTNHLNFCKILTTKTLLQQEARWWKILSGLDLAIEYCEEKSNPADGSFQCLDYIDKDDKPFYIVSYVTHLLSKRKLAQKAPRKVDQTPKGPEKNTRSDTSEESLPGNLLKNSRKTVNANASPNLENRLPVIRIPEVEKRAFCKRKQGARN